MLLDLLNFDDEISKDNMKEVTNPVFFNNGNIPKEDGLFSYEIFGRPGSEDRKKKWGYLSLKSKFIHPSAYDLFKSLNKKLEDVMLCKKFYIIDENGNMIEDSEKGETGPMFLYKNFDRITFKEGNTRSREKKLSLVAKLKRDEVFIDKWLILPAYYRDVNFGKGSNGRSKVDELNNYYAKLIMYNNNIVSSDSQYTFTGINTTINIQLTLNNIYTYFIINKLSGKTGYIHQTLLGKTIDYSTRSVISAPVFRTDRYEDMEVPFGYTGVPLTQLVVLFYPFYVNFIQNFMKQHEMDAALISTKDNKTEKMLPLGEVFDEPMIKKLLELFVKAETYRFQTICVEDESKQIYRLNMFEKELGREFTLMDLVYLATMEIVADKHVYVTRYPIELMNSCYPSKIAVLSTRKTEPKTINNTYFKNYPHVIPDYPSNINDLVMTVIPNNAYLNDLGGDYDGDTVSLRSVFSKEANAEAEAKIKEKSNFINVQGNISRDIGKEGLVSLYILTMN